MKATDYSNSDGIILVVDEDENNLKEYTDILSGLFPVDRISSSQMGSQALALGRCRRVAMVFTSTELCGDLQGIRLAKKVRLMYPDCIVVLVASSDEYDEESKEMNADVLIKRPLCREEILDILSGFDNI